MYCLRFGGKHKLEAEEKKDDSMASGGHYTNMDTLGPDYGRSYEQPHIYSSKSLFLDMGMDGAVMSTHSRPKAAPIRSNDDSFAIPCERESRFQHELVRAHQDRNFRSERFGSHYGRDVADDTPGATSPRQSRERQEMDVDMSLVHETKMKTESRCELQKDNVELPKELRRTRRVLECEKAQKVALRNRMGNLEEQVVTLRNSLAPSTGQRQPSHHTSAHVQRLEEQLRQLQEKYEDEKLVSQNLQIELDVVKKENDRNKEKLRRIIFQQTPNGTTKFQEIGPVDHKIAETPFGVGNYEFGAQIGEGHYGKVTIGRDTHTNHKFAIKVLGKDRMTRVKDLQQVAIEVHVLRKYPHSNIVHLKEVIHAPNRIYLVTELCSMDLHKYHNEIGLSEFGAKHVILGILKPLYHLHSHGICHLDLKPENILLSAKTNMKSISHYDVRLCDFGLVNMALNPTESKEIVRKGYACGTPGFFAPEMILINEFEGRQADMWSLGCIILELTLGFTQEWIDSYEVIENDPTQFVEGIQHCLQEIAPEHYPMHHKLLDIIHSCLSLNPKKRMDAGAATVHKWLEEVVTSDEGRQDPSNSIVSLPISPPASPTSLYAERSDLVPCIMPC